MERQQRDKLRMIVAVAAASLVDKDEDTEHGVKRLLEGLETSSAQVQQSVEIKAKRAPLNEEEEKETKKRKSTNSKTFELERATDITPHEDNPLDVSLPSHNITRQTVEPSVGLMLHLLSLETPTKAQNFLKRLPQSKLFTSFPSTMRSMLSALQVKASARQRLDVLVTVIKVLSIEYNAHVADDIQVYFDSVRGEVDDCEVDIERKYNITKISMKSLYREILTLLKKVKLSVSEVDEPFTDANDTIDFFIKLSIFTGFVLKVGVYICHCRSLYNDIVLLILDIVEHVIRTDKVEHVIAVSFLINGLTEALNIGGHIRHEQVSSAVCKLMDTPDTGKDSYLILVPKLWYLMHDRFVYSSLTIPNLSVVNTKTSVSCSNNDANNNDNTFNSNPNSPLSNSLAQQSLLALR